MIIFFSETSFWLTHNLQCVPSHILFTKSKDLTIERREQYKNFLDGIADDINYTFQEIIPDFRYLITIRFHRKFEWSKEQQFCIFS